MVGGLDGPGHRAHNIAGKGRTTMAKKKKEDPPNSPITVGGGGGKKTKGKLVDYLYLEFDKNDYIADGDEYSTPIMVLDAVFLNGQRVGTVTATTEVLIEYKKPSDYKIRINKNGKMGVKFRHKDHFPYIYGTHQHYGANCRFNKLKVGNEVIPVDTSRPFTIECHTRWKTRKAGKKR
jgi:hypothetical protein